MARQRRTYTFQAEKGPVEVNLIGLGARNAAIVAQRIAGVIAPAFGALQSGDMVAAGKAISGLPATESWDLLVKFCEGGTTKYTRDDGQEVVAATTSEVLDIALTGYALESYKILLEAIQLNYPEFFRKLT
jgi:hypothetical protein